MQNCYQPCGDLREKNLVDLFGSKEKSVQRVVDDTDDEDSEASEGEEGLL